MTGQSDKHSQCKRGNLIFKFDAAFLGCLIKIARMMPPPVNSSQDEKDLDLARVEGTENLPMEEP